MSLWWLSFCDASKPEGDQFLGAAIVEAADIASAIRAAWALGCNPGGEVEGMWCDPEMVGRLSFQLPLARLIPPDEAKALAERVGQEVGA